jgi:hypothetical protein
VSDRLLYRIRDWEKHFEKAQMRAVESVKWVAMPVKHEGLGYRRLMARPDGLALFGGWNLIVQVAAKCRRGGRLETDLGPLDAHDLSLITGAPAEAMQAALDVFASLEISWLEVVTEPGAAADSTADGRLSATGQDRTEQDNDSCSEPQAASEPAVMTFPVVGKDQPEWGLTAAKLAEFRETFPGIDVQAECLKARQWCVVNPAKRKTPRGMPRFLFGWLEGAQNRGGGIRNGVPPPRQDAGAGPAFDEARRVLATVPVQDEARYRAAINSLPAQTRKALKAMGGTSRIREMTEANRGSVFAAFRSAWEAAT